MPSSGGLGTWSEQKEPELCPTKDTRDPSDFTAAEIHGGDVLAAECVYFRPGKSFPFPFALKRKQGYNLGAT